MRRAGLRGWQADDRPGGGFGGWPKEAPDATARRAKTAEKTSSILAGTPGAACYSAVFYLDANPEVLVSPILTRPVREQLEHDRVIRLLQARYKRKTDVIINPGSGANQSVTVGDLVFIPTWCFAEGSKKLLGTVEVETGESVNALEARAVGASSVS